MQSWVRRSNKIKKEKDNRKIQWRINIEIINRIMYVIATVTLIILMGMLIFITAYSHNDLVISIMSLLMLVLSVFLSVKKLNPYMAFVLSSATGKRTNNCSLIVVRYCSKAFLALCFIYFIYAVKTVYSF